MTTGSLADMSTCQLALMRDNLYGHPAKMDDLKMFAWIKRDLAETDFHNGNMYFNGDGWGVQQDFDQAARLFRKAAERGHVDAQFNLGLMYRDGQGVPQDRVQAHLWADLAAAQGDEDAKGLRKSVERRMTPAQIAEAQKLATAWHAKRAAQP